MTSKHSTTAALNELRVDVAEEENWNARRKPLEVRLGLTNHSASTNPGFDPESAD